MSSAALGPRFEPWIVVALAVLACVVVVGGYLAIEVPGPWLVSESPRRFAAIELQLTRGKGVRAPSEFLVQAPGEGGLAIISLATDLRADRFRGVAWDVADLPDSAQARVLWLSDTDPGRMQSLPAVVEAGRIRPLVVAGAPGWVGSIRGLGLSVGGPLVQPFHVRGVSAKPMGAGEVLADRAREWFSFEGWRGTSINVVVGGDDMQDLPLPALVAAIVAVAVLGLVALHRWRPRLLPHAGTALALLFLCGWLVLDLRWGANLARQVAVTWNTFGGKSEREKRLADADAALFEFVERVRASLPPTPQRIWIASDAPYFNGRAAYHLYPHNVHFSPRDRAMPNRSFVRPGDWMLVFNRRGVEYNPRNGTLRWDGGADVAAELKVPGNAAALFLIK